MKAKRDPFLSPGQGSFAIQNQDPYAKECSKGCRLCLVVHACHLGRIYANLSAHIHILF